MKILFVRHGEPNYEKDYVTEKGAVEAELVSHLLTKLDVKEFYCSPMGRAVATSKPTLEKLGRTATECSWLREFWPKIRRPDMEGICPVVWDWLPADWSVDERFYDANHWFENERYQEANVKEAYDEVCTGFDGLLEKHGYVREGKIYRAVEPNNDTIVLFCHFGITATILSHIMNVSPVVLWHHTITAPTSITTLVSEERREGSAIFRLTGLGDVSHLYAEGEKPSFSGRFRETWFNEDERRD